MNYTVAVRALCEFTARTGDLDLRYTPAPSALEGMAGHALVQSRRGKEYETEIALAGQYEDMKVRGRADGFDPRTVQLEEIKTYRGKIESVHVAPESRGLGIGALMIRHALAFAGENGVGLVELSSNKARIDAHRFYRNLGFDQSHEGFKKQL